MSALKYVRTHRVVIIKIFFAWHIPQWAVIFDWIRHSPRRSFKGALSVIFVIVHVVVVLCIIVARHHVRRQNELLMAVSTVVNNKALLIILRHSRLVSRTLIITGVVVVSRLNLAIGV